MSISFFPTSTGYDKYYFSHDGEGDDILSNVIAKDALQDDLENVTVDCVIGNPDIVHALNGQDDEMAARISLTNQIFAGNVAIGGAKANDQISQQYMNGILGLSPEKKCLVLHTSSFKSLQAIFNGAVQGQLKNVVVLAYGSVNLSWAMPKPENYAPFYESLNASGAKLALIEGFPFLGLKNKITPENTPVTFLLLKNLDGPAGQKWLAINAAATAKVRGKQAIKIADYICEGIGKASPEQRETLIKHFMNVASAFGIQRPALFEESGEALAASLKDILNGPFNGKSNSPEYQQLTLNINEIRKLLLDVLDVNAGILNRPFNIFLGTCLEGQALIADQIPAIIFSELVEGRENGLAKECMPVHFDGFNSYAQYALSEVQGSLYYLDTKKKLEKYAPHQQESEQVDSYLKYIDLCMAAAIMANDRMITASHPLASAFLNQIVELSCEVKRLGYDLPKSCRAFTSI